MALRSLVVFDSENMVVDRSSSDALVGNPIINNSDTPDGTVFTYTGGSGQTVTLDDTGGNADTFEDDDAAGHTITDGAGLVANGTGVDAESLIQIQQIDDTGTPFGPVITLTVFSRSGTTSDVWGFSSDSPLADGAQYQKVGGNNDGTSEYSSFVACFGPGTLIDTGRGEVAIEALRRGDQVWTSSAGRRPVEWIGRTTVRGRGALAPVVIDAGALGNDRPLTVSQEHRMFFADATAELLFGAPEILVAAKHLCGLPGIRIAPRRTITYTHLMFDRHHIVRAGGLLSESFFLSELALSGTDARVRSELLSLFPDLDRGQNHFGPSAALCLKRHEARMWHQYLAA